MPVRRPFDGRRPMGAPFRPPSSPQLYIPPHTGNLPTIQPLKYHPYNYPSKLQPTTTTHYNHPIDHQSGPIALVFRDRFAKTENSARYSRPFVVMPPRDSIFASDALSILPPFDIRAFSVTAPLLSA